jgi:hypothetical protein
MSLALRGTTGGQKAGRSSNTGGQHVLPAIRIDEM